LLFVDKQKQQVHLVEQKNRVTLHIIFFRNSVMHIKATTDKNPKAPRIEKSSYYTDVKTVNMYIFLSCLCLDLK